MPADPWLDDASRASNAKELRRMVFVAASYAVAYLALGSLTAIALAAYGAYGCYEECRSDVADPAWQHDSSAWQWNAMLWLGVFSIVAAIAFVGIAWRFRSEPAAIALALNLASATAGGLLLHASGEVSAFGAALCLSSLAALGCLLVVTRRKLIARPYRTRGEAT
jgi:hypothetical protein